MSSEEKMQWKEKEEEAETQKEARMEKLNEIEEKLLAMEPFNDLIVVYDEKVLDTDETQEKKEDQECVSVVNEEESKNQYEYNIEGVNEKQGEKLGRDQEDRKEEIVNESKVRITEVENENCIEERKKDLLEVEGNEKSFEYFEPTLLAQGKFEQQKEIRAEESLLPENDVFHYFPKETVETNSKNERMTKITKKMIPLSLDRDTKEFEKFRLDYRLSFNSIMAEREKKAEACDELLYEYSKLAKYALKDAFIIQRRKGKYFYLEDNYELLKELENLPFGKIGYGKVGRQGKDRHYTLVRDIQDNMLFKEIEGKIYARWRKPLRRYTRTDIDATPDMFFWLFDRVVLKDYDFNGNYKLARKIRSAFRKEKLEGRDYFILKKDFSSIRKIIQAKYYELDRTNEIDRFRNMSRKALANCLEAAMKGKEGGYTTGGLSIPIIAHFEVYYVNGKKLWTEVFRTFNERYENLYDIPKSLLWKKVQELELKMMKPLKLKEKHISFDTTTLRDNFYTLEDGKTFVTANNINSAWYEPCSNNWMFKASEYIFENQNNRAALFENKLIDNVLNNEKKVYSMTNNSTGTDTDRPIDGWTCSFDTISPFELFEIKKVGSRLGGPNDHIRDVIKTVGWVFIGKSKEIRNSVAYKINFYTNRTLLSHGIDKEKNFVVLNHWKGVKGLERLSETVENARIIRQGVSDTSTPVINRPLKRTISPGELNGKLKNELKLIQGYRIDKQAPADENLLKKLEEICNEARSTPDIYYRVLDFLVKKWNKESS